MQYKLLKPVNPKYSALVQVLTNRGIAYEDIQHYLNTTDGDINSPSAFGEQVMKRAAAALVQCAQKNGKCLVVVDADCDGYTSSAILLNYLNDILPTWTQTKVEYILHDGKQHGLADCIDSALAFDLVIVPDAGSNDFNEHSALHEAGIPVIILDHHELEEKPNEENAIIINNHYSEYPNKQLSGAGVAWQFCRYLDSLLKTNYAEKYLDLVALGNMADMMSLTSIETKHLITKGFSDENIKNPFIYTMAEKNSFSLKGKITPMGAAFYIAPFVNAMVRSGTQEEKELLFSSMLTFKAFTFIPSQKRGHAPGEQARVVDEAVRVATNVKARQTKAQDTAMETIEGLIETRQLLQHQVLLFLLKPGQIDRNIAGLVANKIMAKYQRPCAILTKIVHDDDEVYYEGSARGCDLAGITEFKDICEHTGYVEYCAGHQGAFGLGIKEKNIESFLAATDAALKDMPTEPIYYVDYIYDNLQVSPDDILAIASLEDLWGKDMPESLIAVRNIKVSANMVTVYHKKDNTLKIQLPNGISIMKFKASDELCDMLQNQNPGYYIFDIVGTCNRNEWMGNVSPQIFIENYEIHGQSKYDF